MTAIGKNEIWHRVGIKATPAAVYLALTDTKKLALWWTTDVRGESVTGKTLEFWFGKLCQQMNVIALEPGKTVRWRATDKGLPDWKDTEIEFSIVASEGQTFVYFAHLNWTQDGEMFPHYSTRWAMFLLSLKELLETGKGHPSPHDVSICH
jgi:uncharacterized protein YndB with AHSA1/START domain